MRVPPLAQEPRSHMLSGKQAHVPQLLSLCSRAGKPQLLRPMCSTAHAPQQEKLGPCKEEESLLTATKESPCAAKSK